MYTKQYARDLSSLNTFRMKARARYYIEWDSVSDLIEMDFEEMARPIKCLGQGSNLLFTKDFEGTILHSKLSYIEILEESSPDEVIVSVGSGVIMDELCEWACKKGLWGIENLSGIPGTAGGAAVQNIGAYGCEIADSIKSVGVFDIESEEFALIDVKDCTYAYRSSIFKCSSYIVTHVVLRLSRTPRPRLDYGHIAQAVGDNVSLQGIRSVILSTRASKLPDVASYGSAGSFFKNPVISLSQYKEKLEGLSAPHYDLPDSKVKIPAAWLIEQCGWKGRRNGNAGVWEKQPLVLVNLTGEALPEEILSLEARIRQSVEKAFGIILECEVEHL